MIIKLQSGRLKQVLEDLTVLSSLCSVLGLDFKETVRELNPSLADSEENHSISTLTLQQLESAIKRLRELKLQRRQRVQKHHLLDYFIITYSSCWLIFCAFLTKLVQLQDLATMLLELWNLMDTPVEEQQAFQHVTCNIAASDDEMTDPNMLSDDFIEYVCRRPSYLFVSKSSQTDPLIV